MIEAAPGALKWAEAAQKAAEVAAAADRARKRVEERRRRAPAKAAADARTQRRGDRSSMLAAASGRGDIARGGCGGAGGRNVLKTAPGERRAGGARARGAKLTRCGDVDRGGRRGAAEAALRARGARAEARASMPPR